MRSWAIRTDQARAEDLIVPELRAGRLRQGWGWEANQDLRFLRAARSAGRPLSARQRAAWRNWPLLDEDHRAIRDGDLLVLPNIPRRGSWSIARAAPGYSYQPCSASDDHRHIRRVELLREAIDPHGPGVPAGLRRSLFRTRCRIWRLDHYGEAIERLVGPDTPSAAAVPLADPIAAAKVAAIGAFGEHVRDAFGGAELEEPVERALQAIYEQVERRAGRGEHGADFLCHHKDPLGARHTTAVQVKNWTGIASDHEPLNQLRTAHAYWPGLTAAAILTMAEGVSPDFELARQALEHELGIPVTVVIQAALLDLLLRHAGA